MEHPDIVKFLDGLIRDDGDYLFMALVVLGLIVIGWLLVRRPPSPPVVNAGTRAMIGTMLASPDMMSDADGGRTRLIVGQTPQHGPPFHDE